MMWCAIRQKTSHVQLWIQHGIHQQRATAYWLAKRNLQTTTFQHEWSSQEIRETFIKFFLERDHQFVRSSSVVPKKDEGSYFVNAGMNQFKPLFLGTVNSDSEMSRYKRVANSQKCIRVGGKHNDLADVGRDTYHHTFFEMLGSWSFGDYFKKEACAMAWDLITDVYSLPKERLFVTYFGGNQEFGIPADTICRDIWIDLGVSPERVLPFGMSDNFWDMGETGPCGPCTEIHYDRRGGIGRESLVNSCNPEVIELWNLVFMQYNRETSGALKPLPSNHVDTGMGLERITAVLQGKESNYDTDLFIPIFDAIHKECGCPKYQGRLGNDDVHGIDTAYRIVADHARMSAICIADGMLPGKGDRNSKLRYMIHRSLRQAYDVLKAQPGLLPGIIPVLVPTLSMAFPELEKQQHYIIEILKQTEERYRSMIADGRKTIQKALNKYGDIHILSGSQLFEIHEGRFGQSLPLDIIVELALELGIESNVSEFEDVIARNKEKQASVIIEEKPVTFLDVLQLEKLQSDRIKPTADESKYDYRSSGGKYVFPPLRANVVALLSEGKFVPEVSQETQCEIIMDKTNMYSEGGGQISDTGCFVSEDCEVYITDIQCIKQYVVHTGVVKKGSVKVGTAGELMISEDRRVGCMKNHSATHILNFALNEILGSVRQQGSLVTENKLSFDFSCAKTSMEDEDLKNIQNLAQDIVNSGHAVYRGELPFGDAKNVHGIRMLADELYPRHVRVVSLGHDIPALLSQSEETRSSVELCGGTHVHNTKDIGHIIITNLTGATQNVKRLTAITGIAAEEALLAAKELESHFSELRTWISSKKHLEKWEAKTELLEKLLTAGPTLPKLVRDKLLSELEALKLESLSQVKNKMKKLRLEEALKMAVQEHLRARSCVAELNFQQPREILGALVKESPPKPTMLASNIDGFVKAICYIPEDTMDQIELSEWTAHIKNTAGGTVAPSKGKFAKYENILILNFEVQNDEHLQVILDVARDYIMAYS